MGDVKLSEQECAALWRAYKTAQDKAARDRLVENYLPLVNIIAGRIAVSLPAHVDRDELISSGFFGLMDAVERYDAGRQNKFETYAGVRIRGAMLDYLRSKDWIPSSVRQKARMYEKCVGELENRLRRTATDEEIAAAMGITMRELTKLEAQLNVATVIPLEDYMRAESAANAAPSPLDEIEKQERQELLAAAIERLPDRERQVVSLYYHEEMTMKEISLVMHISEARVCQLHTKAIFRLRGYLSREKANFVD